MLEGKELEGSLGTDGSYFVDVDTSGKVTVGLEYKKQFSGGSAKSSNQVEIGIMAILEKTAQATKATWDDAVVAQIKALLKLAS